MMTPQMLEGFTDLECELLCRVHEQICRHRGVPMDSGEAEAIAGSVRTWYLSGIRRPDLLKAMSLRFEA